MKKSSSNRWLKEHFIDVYVKRAKDEGFRARSVYKLKDIDERLKLIKPNYVVVDLGAAPGGWSQYVVSRLALNGRVFALDILPMQPIYKVKFIQGDFTNNDVVQHLINELRGKKVDLVLSDMAPNLSGVKLIDQMRTIELASQALYFAKQVLQSKGTFLLKIFQGGEFSIFLKKLYKIFDEVKVLKPEASRARSSEVFLLSRNIK